MARLSWVLGLLVVAGGCTAEEAPGYQSADILEGTLATAYPEAVHVNALNGDDRPALYSGVLIAPQVVLTGGYPAWA